MASSSSVIVAGPARFPHPPLKITLHQRLADYEAGCRAPPPSPHKYRPAPYRRSKAWIFFCAIIRALVRANVGLRTDHANDQCWATFDEICERPL